MTSQVPNSSSLNVLYWLMGTIMLPLAIPWLIYRLVEHKKARERIRGKVVLITGASSGLGEALAHTFFRAGCKVILASRNMEQLSRVRSDLLASHLTVETFTPEVVQLDLSDLKSIPAVVVKAIQIHGRIDILINNGGTGYRGCIQKTSADVDMKVMAVNYFGQVCLTKAVLECMAKNGEGHVVAISSVQGKISIPYRSAYSASKHALQAFCDCLRAEVSRLGIKVTVVSPGYIKTNLSVNAVTGSGETYGVLDDVYKEEAYTPEEVAERVFSTVLRGKEELIIAPLLPRAAIVLRVLCPSLYFWIMNKRALKSPRIN